MVFHYTAGMIVKQALNVISIKRVLKSPKLNCSKTASY